MGKRLRLILVAIVGLITSLTLVGTPAPAHADVRTAASCTTPHIYGSVTPTTNAEGSYALRLGANGSAPATCSAYRWSLNLHSQSTGTVRVSSMGMITPRDSSQGFILFPTTSFWAPPGDGLMTLEVVTSARTSFGMYLPTATQTYYLEVPASSFSTSTLSGAPTNATCSTGGPGDPIVGQKGWC